MWKILIDLIRVIEVGLVKAREKKYLEREKSGRDMEGEKPREEERIEMGR
jgi:hypothetical protein